MFIRFNEIKYNTIYFDEYYSNKSSIFFKIYNVPDINIITLLKIIRYIENVFFNDNNYSADYTMLFKNILLFTYIIWGRIRVLNQNLNRNQHNLQLINHLVLSGKVKFNENKYITVYSYYFF